MIALLALHRPAEGPRRVAPERPLGEILSPNDYPLEAMARGSEGRVSFLLEVGRAGEVRKCRIEASSGDPDLDRATCAIMQERARFRPALDKNGRPLPDRWQSSVTWQIDDARPSPDRLARFVTTVARNARGEISCSIEMDGTLIQLPFGGRCDFPEAVAALDSVQGRRGWVRLTKVIVMRPVGSPAPGAGDDAPGMLLYEWEGRLGVAPDGRVAACRATLRVGHAGDFARLGAPDPCIIYAGEPVFRPARSGTGVRFVHARHAFYGQTGD
jgi:TonB family protein